MREKIALFADVAVEAVVSAPDADDIYAIPLMMQAEGLDRLACERLGLVTGPADMREWEAMVERIHAAEGTVRIALVGKYVQLQDAYLSVVEALRHAAIHHGTKLEIVWVDAETLSWEEAERRLSQVDGILIPGGFGIRGIEGKIAAARFAREQSVPYLGVCLGMQVAVVEFARHVVGLEGANSSEFDSETPYPVIDLLPEQKQVEDMGGTMRLGIRSGQGHGGHRSPTAPTARPSSTSATGTATRSTTACARSSSRTASSSRARRPTSGWSRSSSCRTTRGSAPASSIPSSSPGPTARSRCSATSSAPPSPAAAAGPAEPVAVAENLTA